MVRRRSHNHDQKRNGRWRKLAGAGIAAALVVGGLSLMPRADAATTVKGPDPSAASVNAATGPFAVSRTTVGRGNGFGGATIFFPTDTSQGTFGAVAIAPGFTARQSSISWMGPRFASQGFVVMTIDTNSTSDNPTSRSRQLLAALDFLTKQSTVRTRVDPNRLAVMGHSMGGGGTMEAAQARSSLKAAIPLAGWDTRKNFSSVTVPTLVIGAQRDTIAPVNSHSKRFFSSLPAQTEKGYVELAGGSHFTPNSPNNVIASMSISWLKTFVDDDPRYEQFLCGSAPRGASAKEVSCPL
jgi:dienelactone hydrolase